MSTPLLPWDDPVPEPAPSVSSDVRAGPPPARRLVCTTSASSRLALVATTLSGDPQEDWLVLAPTRAQADAVVRTACATSSAVVGRQRMGVSEFAFRLATPRLAEEQRTPTTPLGYEAVVARALAGVRDRHGLGLLAGVDEHPGFLGALAATLQDVRLAGIAPDALAACPRTGPSLAALAHALEQTLHDLGQADRALVWRWALDALRAGHALRPAQPAASLLVVDPACASRLETEVIAEAVARAPRALVVGPVGDAGLTWLARLLDLDVETLDDHSSDLRPARKLTRVQRLLFTPTGPLPVASPDDASVSLLSAPGEGRECLEIARTLLEAAGGGMPFDAMAVVVRAPHLYASQLETALRRAGIPAWFSHGSRRPDPSGRALLALIACALEDVSADRFAEYLSLGQVPDYPAASDVLASPPTPEPSAPTDAAARRSPWRWEAILNDACVIGGSDRWRRRLEGFRQELLTRADVIAVDEPDAPRVSALRRHAALVDELLDFAMPLVDRLTGWRLAPAPWRVWLERLRELATLALSRPAHVIEVLDELTPLSDVQDVPLAEVHDVLRERLTHVSISPPDEPYGRVFVGTPDDLRGRSFSLVCVAGLSERVFPQRSRQDPLLLDAAREALSPWLVTDSRRVADERLRLHLAAGAARDRLVTSFSSFDAAQSRPRVPSFYALDIQRTCGGDLPGYERVLREAQQTSGARLAWPAPSDADRAVDRLEHDLSVLQRHLRGAIDDVRGKARYLLEAQPSLRRSLVMRHDRTRRAWTASDGIVADAATVDTISASLARHRLHARAYSVSALQRYAVCPYQFYLSTIVRLSPRETAAPVTSMDPLTRGSIVHEVLAEVMRAFEAARWLPLTADRLAEARALADQVLDRVTESHRDRLMPPIARIWLDEIHAMRRDLHEWVGRLPDDQRGWTPALVEFGFGFGRGDGRDTASVRDVVVLPEGTRLHGVIDLAEKGADDTWRITDYKTGRNRLAPSVLINRGETLQPALYAMALEAAVGGRVVASRLWFCTADGAYTQQDVPVDVTRNGQARQKALEVLAAVDRAVATGFLPAAPKDGACTWCDFRAVCGPEAQTQTRRKPRALLDDLLTIRSQR